MSTWFFRRLEMEVVAYCGIGKIVLPSSDMFIENIVKRLDRNQNSEKLETCKVYLKNYRKERRKDPVKNAMNAATQKRYSSTPRGKNRGQDNIRKKVEREMEYMPVV